MCLPGALGISSTDFDSGLWEPFVENGIRSMDAIDYHVYNSVQIRVFLAQLVDLLYRVQYCRVVLASKHPANLGQG